MSKTPPSADDRKRAAAIGKRLKHVKSDKKWGVELLRRKQQALLDLADNEDWLVGKPQGEGEAKAESATARVRPDPSV